MNLKKKMILLFTSITIIPFTCMIIFAYTQYVHIINKHITSIADNQYESLYQDLRDSYSSIQRALGSLTFYSSMDDNSILSSLRQLNETGQNTSDYDILCASQNIETACQSAMYDQNYINGIYIFTLDRSVFGHSKFATNGISSDYDPLDDEWYQETLDLNGRIYISSLNVYPMFHNESECYFAAQLIRDVDRQFKPLGVIVIEYSPDIFDLSQKNALADISLITVTNTVNGSIIYTNVEGDSMEFIPDEKNSTITSVFRTPFTLSMTIDYASLAAEYNQTLFLLIVLALFCITCVLIMIIHFTRSFINPIQELSNRMVKKKKVNTDSPYACENRKDEIGILYRQYNNMMSEIDESIKTEYQNKLIILDSQMKALEARINSHFLFNTLESINSMAELADQKQISTMSLALGRMFRYAIKTVSELVPLKDELNHVRDYITIQQIRCDNKFQYIQDVPEELYNHKILKLIFQPIVENSLSYGLEYGNSGDQILLSARLIQEQLLITISDNGKGIPTEQLKILRQRLHEEATFTELGHRKKESIGLKNIQSRIELYYGKGYGLTIESTEGEGTKIEILVPIFPGSEEVETHV